MEAHFGVERTGVVREKAPPLLCVVLCVLSTVTCSRPRGEGDLCELLAS